MKLKERFMRFMQGRYGADAFSRFLLWASVICVLVSGFAPGIAGSILYTISVVGLIYCYFRMFSRNYEKRYRENQMFLNRTAGIRSFFSRQKNLMAQRKTHHIYTCPGCKQKIRIPKGRGKIEISCPKCHTKFIKRS